MAKAKTKKAKPATKPASAAKPAAKKPAAAKKSAAAKKPATKKPAKAGAKVQKVVTGAKKIAQNPMTSEVVAATLVAAAAALRDPKKAKALALSAADDLKKAAKSGVDSGEAMWKLALDVARRSIDALGGDGSGGKKGKAKKKK